MFCVTALLCLLGLTACGLFDARPVVATAQPMPVSATPSRRITQLDFGNSARYANCIEPACPSTTPKTLAVVPVPAVPVACGRSATDVIAGTGSCAAAAIGTAGTGTTAKVLGVVEGHAGSVQLA